MTYLDGRERLAVSPGGVVKSKQHWPQNRSRDTAIGYQVSINKNLKVVAFSDHLR
jgi:hypothetical protein